MKRFGVRVELLGVGGKIQHERRLLRHFALQIAAQGLGQRLHEFAGIIARIHFELFQPDIERLARLHVNRLRFVSLIVDGDLELGTLGLLAPVESKVARGDRSQLAFGAGRGRDVG